MKRFNPGPCFNDGTWPRMEDDKEGDYVLFEDYVALLGKLSAASNAPPVNPDATQALVTALRAILDYSESLTVWRDFPDDLVNLANNALRMAQLPVVPVVPHSDYIAILDELTELKEEVAHFMQPKLVVPASEDVHLRLGPCRCHDCARARSEDVETIRKELQNDPLWMEFQTNTLAALDRLAAAAGAEPICKHCGKTRLEAIWKTLCK